MILDFSILYRSVVVAKLMNMFANMSVLFWLHNWHCAFCYFARNSRRFRVIQTNNIYCLAAEGHSEPDGAAAIPHIISELLWWVYRSVRVNQMPQDSTDGVLYRIFPRPSSGSSLWPLSPLSFGTTGRPKNKYSCTLLSKVKEEPYNKLDTISLVCGVHW